MGVLFDLSFDSGKTFKAGVVSQPEECTHGTLGILFAYCLISLGHSVIRKVS